MENRGETGRRESKRDTEAEIGNRPDSQVYRCSMHPVGRDLRLIMLQLIELRPQKPI